MQTTPSCVIWVFVGPPNLLVYVCNSLASSYSVYATQKISESTFISTSLKMSQGSINVRPNEEALAALLIIAVLDLRSLFSIAKAVGNYFLGSRFKEDERGSDIDKVDLEPEPVEEQSRIEVDREGTPSIQNDDARVQDKKDEGSQSIQAEAQPLSTQHHLNREVALNTIRARDEDTTSRTPWEEAQSLGILPSLEWRELNGGKSQWEPSTEALRLLSRGRRKTNHNRDRGAVNDWEPDEWDVRRKYSREKGLEATRAWGQAAMHRYREDEVSWEPLRSAEEYERKVLFRWSPRRLDEWESLR